MHRFHKGSFVSSQFYDFRISSTNRLVDEDSTFHVLHPAVRSETVGKQQLSVREVAVQGPGGMLLVWYCYWIDSQYTASNYAGKLLQAKAKLQFKGDDGAVVMLSAPYQADADVARRAMRAFLGGNLPAIDATLTAAKGG